MVERRDSERPVRLSQTPQVSRGQVQQARVGQAGGAFGTHVTSAPQIIRGDHAERQGSVLVQHLLKSVGGMLDAVIDDRRQQAYLDGALAVGAGIAEEDLQTNPLTRVWSLAGHRDYSGRLAALEYESRLAAELSKDREYSPEEYAQKLSERRKAIMPIIEGMSREARGRMLDQLLTAEASAISNHKAAHAEYVSELEAKLAVAEINTGMDKVMASPDPETREAALGAVFTKLFHNIANNPNLDPKQRASMVTDAVKYALALGDFGLYTAVTSVGVLPGPDGELMPIAATLPFDKRVELKRAEQAATSKYFLDRYENYELTYLDLTTRIEAGVPVSPNEVDDMVRATLALSQAGSLSADKASSRIAKLSKAVVQQANLIANLEIWTSGDRQAMVANAVNDAEMAQQIHKQMYMNYEPVEAFTRLLGVYRGNGSPKLGELLGADISGYLESWLRSSDPEEGMPRGLRTMFDGIVGLATEGIQGDSVISRDITQILVGQTSPELRTFLNTVLNEVRRGADIDTAAGTARSRLEEWSKLSPSDRKAEIQRREGWYQEVVGPLSESRGAFSTIWLPALLGDELTSTQRQIQIKNEILGGDYTETAAGLLWQMLSGTFRAAAEPYINSASLATKEELTQLMQVEMQTKVKLTDAGFLVGGPGVDFHTFFNIPRSVEPTEVGGVVMDHAIKQHYEGLDLGELHQEFFFFAKAAQGRAGPELQVYALNKTTGTLDQPFILPYDEFKNMGADYIVSQLSGAKDLVTGVALKGKTGDTIRIRPNRHTTNLTPQRVKELAESLAQYEDVRLMPYKDGKDENGNQLWSFSVGLNSGTPAAMRVFREVTGYDTLEQAAKALRSGELSQEIMRDAAELAFMETFSAIYNEVEPIIEDVLAHRPARQGMVDRRAVEDLLTHLYWQAGGPRFKSGESYQKLVQTLKDPRASRAQALSALEKTPAFKAARGSRQSFYKTLVREIFTH